LDLFNETTRLGRGMLYVVNKYPNCNDKPSEKMLIRINILLKPSMDDIFRFLRAYSAFQTGFNDFFRVKK
jgi:hypothetical protein